MNPITLEHPLVWSQVAALACGEASLELSKAAQVRIEAAHSIVMTVVQQSIRAYGVNTGVGALSDHIIPREQQGILSRNVLLSHAVGVGTALPAQETRAIMVAMVNNFAHGYSGLRLCVVQRIVDLLNADCLPEVPQQGSVGYISHAAHVGLALIGQGAVILNGERLTAAAALTRLQLQPLVLEAKEGLCLVNGTPCVTGLSCLILSRVWHLMNWADVISAMTFETQRCQLNAFNRYAMRLRASPGLLEVTDKLSHWLTDSGILAAAVGRRTQDALSLRAIPQIHGAIRDTWREVTHVVDRELSSVTDNPIVAGTAAVPQIYSQAHAVGASVGLAMDQIAIAVAELGGHSGSRLDRMVNPLISELPAFLAQSSGTASGFMIAQYTAVSLIGENRRLAAPASLDGGTTSGLQEDILCHATPAALKALQISANVQSILAIELLAAAQSYDLLDPATGTPARHTRSVYRALRERMGTYADDRPLGEDISAAVCFIKQHTPDEIFRQAGIV